MLKVKVRTVKEGEFEVQVEPTETVDNLKEKIEAKAGHQKAWQKIIFSGKILDGAQTMESCGIKDGDFVVLIAKAPRTAAPATKEEPKPAEQPKPEDKPTTPATQPQTAPSTTQTPSTGSGDNSAFEEQVKGLMEMGFPREQVIKALRAAFNNSDRAVQYLLGGGDIPDVGAFGEEEMMQPGEEMEEEEEEEDLGGQIGTGGGPGTFDFLTQHPQFQTLRAMVQANPQLLQVVLQQLGQSNPELLTMINENQEEFVRLLQGPLPQGAAPQPGAQPGQPGGQPGGAPPGVQYIQVSPEEKAAIDRLCTLGFPRSKVIEAFFACDKDEQLAANYLLENIGDEMDDQ
jgi:UV excision repair protein RAD23